MRAAASGSLVASLGRGIRGLPGASAYSGVQGRAHPLSRGLRVELHGSGVSVTTILPGYIATEMTAAQILSDAFHHRCPTKPRAASPAA
jgi:NAD(P)-dependent dehydrogenase (short-subunit alcohol dehydrogenase family)